MTNTPERPSGAATAAHDPDPGSAADTLDQQLVDALLELRAAADRLRRVDSILARIVANTSLTGEVNRDTRAR